MSSRTLTGAAARSMLPDVRAGFFGKLPARGDFLRENLPREFTDPWDSWWQRGMAQTQHVAGDCWRDAWLVAPVWRFMLPPGLYGRLGVLGLWLPSVDRSGRYFPLTIAATAATDWAPHAEAMIPFLAAAEQAGRDALEHDLAPHALLQRVEDGLSADGSGDAPAFVPGRAAWWTEGGARVAPRQESGIALPEGGRFAALIDDAWGAVAPASEPATIDTPEPS